MRHNIPSPRLVPFPILVGRGPTRVATGSTGTLHTGPWPMHSCPRRPALGSSTCFISIHQVLLRRLRGPLASIARKTHCTAYIRTSWRADSRSCECACTPYLLVPTSHSSGDVSLQGVARRRRVGRAHPHAFLQKGLEIRFLRRRVASIPPCPEAQFASSNCWTDGCRVHLAPSPYRFLCQSLFIQVAPFLGRRKILSPPASGGNNLVSLGVGASCEPVIRNCGVARADDCGTMRSKMPIYLRWL